MFRAHELIAALNPECQDYADCMAAVKFDLGDMDKTLGMADVSSFTFFNIPAPVCLFQVTQEMDLHFFLAKQDFGGTVWRRYGKQLNDGFRWGQEDVEFFIGPDGKTIIATRISSGDVLTRGGDTDIADMTEAERWTILHFIKVAASIEVFSCSNVATVEHRTPKLINDKRKKKGKPLFFSYRTLQVTGDSAAKETTGKGTHASPRLHLRRGHIRRLPDGRRVWVTSCLVGDKTKGFAAHDYKVRLAPNIINKEQL